jgi:hypothetical protein
LVFEQFREYGIKLKAKKCDLCKKEVCFLGRKVTRNGLAIGDEYVEAVKEWVRPENTKQVEQFLESILLSYINHTFWLLILFRILGIVQKPT